MFKNSAEPYFGTCRIKMINCLVSVVSKKKKTLFSHCLITAGKIKAF